MCFNTQGRNHACCHLAVAGLLGNSHLITLISTPIPLFSGVERRPKKSNWHFASAVAVAAASFVSFWIISPVSSGSSYRGLISAGRLYGLYEWGGGAPGSIHAHFRHPLRPLALLAQFPAPTATGAAVDPVLAVGRGHGG